MNYRVAFIVLAWFLALPLPAHAQLQSLETDDLRLLYNELPHSFLAPHAARCFENAIGFYRRVLGYTPSEKVTVFLDDSSDYNNASAWSAPRNSILVQIAPTNTVYETAPSNERINHTMNHEMAHIAALDKAEGSDVFFRTVFGGKIRTTNGHPETILYNILTEPRRSAPRWYHEGFATFLETWMAGGLGRAQGAYDEMVFRAMVRDSSRFYDPVSLESEGTRIDFQVGANAYLYGTRFMSYLGLIYGPESVLDWVPRSPDSKRYFSAEFPKVFGVSLGEAWQDWIDWEHGFQRANLDSIELYPLTPYRDLSDKPLGSVSRAFYDPTTESFHVAANYPGVAGHIASISMRDGSIDRITDVKGPALYFVTSLAYDPDENVLFYTAHNGEWRDLYSADPATGKAKRLIKDARIGDLVFNRTDRSLWGVRHFNAVSTVVRIPYPYDKWNQVYSPPYGQVIYDLDISPDGKLLSMSYSEINGRQTLRVVEMEALLAGKPVTDVLFDFGSSLPANFVFSGNGEYLYGSSYYSGVSNIWRYDVAADSMDMITNCETGFFRPVPLSGDSLIVFRYTGEGFVPALVEGTPLEDASAITFLGQQVAEKHPVVREWNVGSPLSVNLDSLVTHTGPYQGLSHIGLAGIYPVVMGYKDFAAVGLQADFSDPGYRYSIGVDLSYSPSTNLDADERFHATVDLGRGPWDLGFKYNGADFYDLFGPTKRSRKGTSLALSYRKNLITDQPTSLDFNISTAGYVGLERLPYAQNIDATFDNLWNTIAQLNYKNMTASLGAVDYEKGYRWKLFAANNYADGRDFPLFLGAFDFGFPFLFKHSSLWLRTAGGYSPGDPASSFSNFYFGGFGNNYVDDGEVKRYREWYSYPGIPLNAIGGTNFAKAMLEWNAPPLRFRHIGNSWFYATWARLSLFSTGIVTDMEDPDTRTGVINAGSQVDVRFTLLSRLKMTFSLGYAVAVEEDQRLGDEFMWSLKIL